MSLPLEIRGDCLGSQQDFTLGGARQARQVLSAQSMLEAQAGATNSTERVILEGARESKKY